MMFLIPLGLLHAAPFSLLGLLVAFFTGSWPYTTRGPAIVCRMSKFLLWFFPRDFNVAAFTWGCILFTARDLLDRSPVHYGIRDRALVKHEMEHVFQAMRWGPLFPFLYLGSMLVAKLQGKRPYADCFFELQAKKAEVKL